MTLDEALEANALRLTTNRGGYVGGGPLEAQLSTLREAHEEMRKALERHADVAHNCISTLLKGAAFDHESNRHVVQAAAYLAVYNALVGISWDRALLAADEEARP